MKTLIVALLALVCIGCIPRNRLVLKERGQVKAVVAEKKEQRVIDIYIYETRQLNHTTTFYSWVSDTDGGDCEVEGTCPEIEIGWLQCGAMYIENKDGAKGKGISGQSMVFVTIAEPDNGWVDGGSGKPVRIWFGKLEGGSWDGKIYIEAPYKSTYKIRRTVNIRREP